MAQADFTSYLDAPIEDFEAPKVPSNGHYFATVKGWKPGEKSYDGGATKVANVSLQFQLDSADTDVDTTGLTDKDIRAAFVSRDFDISGSQPKQYVIRAIAENAMKLPTKGLTLQDTLNAMKGQPCKVYIEQRTYTAKDGEQRTTADVKNVLPAD